MRPTPFDTVVFDLDGTLADTAPDLAASLNHVLAALGRGVLPEATVRTMIGNGVRALLHRALAATGGGPENAAKAAYPMFMDHYAAHICDRTVAYPGATDTLKALLGAGAKLAICTNKPERPARSLVAALGWEPCFAGIVGGDTLAARKPDPAPLYEAIARAGGGRAVLVGDSIVDAETARAASIAFVAVGYGYRDRPAAELGADALVDNLAALPEVLRGL